MSDRLPQEPPSNLDEPKVEDAERNRGKAPDGVQLTRRQDRNSEATQEAQDNPSGGAHSGQPDPSNP